MSTRRGRTAARKRQQRRQQSYTSPLRPADVTEYATENGADSPYIETVKSLFEAARFLLESDDPVYAEDFASGIAACWLPSPLEPEPNREHVPWLLEALGGTGRAEALVLLRGLSAVLPELEAARARRIADSMAASGVPEPSWARFVGRAVVSGCWLMSHVLGDGDNVILMCRYPDGHQHAVAVYIDHNLGTLVKDAFTGSADLLEQFRELAAHDPDTTIAPIPPADAAARVREALALADISVPPFETETYPAVRPLLDARLATMAAGGRGYQHPEPSPAERDGLLADFFHSPEGVRWGTDADAHEIAGHLVSFRCDYGDGRPLRWSPVVVEILLADWFARKVIGSPTMYAKVPDVLRAWISYAGRRLALRQEHIVDTLAAVDEYAAAFRRDVDDPRAWGPAKAMVQGMLDVGSDRGDEAAVRRHLEQPTDPGRGRERVPEFPASRGWDAPVEEVNWRAVPAELRPRVEEIVAHCDRVSKEVLDGEYATFARRLTTRLARKRPSPLARGETRIWAGGILYALGQLNFLFTADAPMHLPGYRLAEIAGVSPSTIAAKAKTVREAAGLRAFDDEFTRADLGTLGSWARMATQLAAIVEGRQP